MERLPSKRVALIGAIVISAVIFISYHPALRIGFYLDDYNYLERAGRTDWSNALAQIFDPRLQTMWYRPLQAIQFFLEFQIFGNNPNAYHIVNIAYHVLNTLLLSALVWRVTRCWRLGFASALFYATFTVYISGVNWIGIVDPLATVFYLLTIWFWWTHLQTGRARDYALALGAFILALLCKQIAVTLPIVLFLAEWWLVGKPLNIARAMAHYAPFAFGAAAFSLIQYATPSTHTFAGVFGWQAGLEMARIFAEYLVLLAFPWGEFPSIDLNPVSVGTLPTYLWLGIALILFIVALIRTRHRALLFLAAFATLNLLPVLPFPFLEHRYTYLPIMASAVLFAALFARAHARWARRAWVAPVCALGLTLLAFGNGIALDASALSAAEWARQLRVPFRDIERQHATLPPDTLLYFIDPITPTTGGLGGMFFLRYGRDVTVKNWTEYARLREHNTAFVYYFDSTRRPREIAVEKNASTQVAPPLPANFGASIHLEGYEVAQTTLRRDTPLVLILYWRAQQPIEHDYTAFAHLVAPAGAIVASLDSPPRKGTAPTSAWRVHLLTADVIVLPIGAEVPRGAGYRVEFGLYDPRTQQRLPVVDAQGNTIADKVSLSSFTLVE